MRCARREVGAGAALRAVVWQAAAALCAAAAAAGCTTGVLALCRLCRLVSWLLILARRALIIRLECLPRGEAAPSSRQLGSSMRSCVHQGLHEDIRVRLQQSGQMR